MTIADRINNIRQEITNVCAKHHINSNKIRLLAVSKTHSHNTIELAYQQGLTEFGESYLQESLEKVKLLKHLPIKWHFIGPIQSNKTKQIAENFDWAQSIDREKLLLRLSQQRPLQLNPLNICIQVNYFDEPQKKGAKPSEVSNLLEIASKLPNIKLRGLMAIPPKTANYQQQLNQFRKIADFYHECKNQYTQMDTLSIGMSNDLEAALVSGSTMIRVGTAIFGVRQSR